MAPSKRNTMAYVAAQSFTALRAIVSNTGCTSVGELDMTPKISLVAVCWSNDSLRSRRARLHLLEQPRVLDGDDGLVGERLQKLDVFLAERMHNLAGQNDCTNHTAFTRERHSDRGAVSANSSPMLHDVRLGWNGLNIRYVNRLGFEHGATKRRLPSRHERSTAHEFIEFARMTVARRERVTIVNPAGIAAASASQRRAADSTSVSRTACRSNVDRLITFSTSAVAVCCWRDFRSSFSRRVFSMAMAA